MHGTTAWWLYHCHCPISRLFLGRCRPTWRGMPPRLVRFIVLVCSQWHCGSARYAEPTRSSHTTSSQHCAQQALLLPTYRQTEIVLTLTVNMTCNLSFISRIDLPILASSWNSLPCYVMSANTCVSGALFVIGLYTAWSPFNHDIIYEFLSVQCYAWTEYKFTCVCVCACVSHFLSTRLQVRPTNGFLQMLLAAGLRPGRTRPRRFEGGQTHHLG